MQVLISRIYGLPKLIEFESIKSPGLTTRVLANAAGTTFSCVLVTNFDSLSMSPIFNQLRPSASLVMYSSIGRGDPPRTIVAKSTSAFPPHSPASRNSGKRSFGTNSHFSALLLIRPQPRNLPPLSELFEQRNQLFHQRQLLLRARLPTQFQRSHKIA